MKMKKFILKAIIIILFFGCDNEKELDLEAVKKSNDLKLIQQKKTEISNKINELQKELKSLNDLIFQLDENQKFTLVSTEKLSFESFKHYIEIQGSVESDKNLVLYPEIPGIIKSIKVKEGDKVKKGATLIELSSTGAKAMLDQLNLKLKLAKTIYERQLNLWNEKIGSEIQFLKAKTDFLSVEKEIIKIKDQLSKTKIIAPFDGVVDDLIAKTGSNVSPGITPILRIINLDQVKVSAEIPEIHLPFIKKGSEVEVFFPVISKKFNATISLVGNVINPNNRNFRIEALIKNKDFDLKPNMTAKISINDYHNPKAILVNQKNIFENSTNEHLVYKIIPSSKNKKNFVVTETKVKLGRNSKNKIEIIKGLNPGDIIIQEGYRMVKNNQIVRIENNNSN
jgi:membrane fusion protein (multidrug efflux system)